MLLVKVVLSLFIFQKYCASNHVIRQNNVLATKLEELQAGEPATKPNEVVTDGNLTTTPHVTTTTENAVCPPDKSLYSRKDIKDILDYVFNGLGLNDSIIENTVPQATAIQQRLSEDLNHFETWFKSKPEHLIHVLQGLSDVRKQQIEPEVQKIAVILKDFPQVKEQINAKQLKIQQLTKKLNKYENLCKYNCEDQDSDPKKLIKRSTEEEHVCSSIADLHKQIIAELAENFDGFINKTRDNLVILDGTLTIEIGNIKSDLKERALKDLGRTMYDVLNLEDEYHHFVKEMNATSVQSLMYTVKDVGLQIDSKLLELQRLVEVYGEYCRNCNSGPVKRLVRETKLTNVNEQTKISIVHELIQDKFNEADIEVNQIIKEIFKDLYKKINDSEWKETFFNNLKLIEKEIQEAGDVERQHLEYLKNIASQESLKKLFDLAATSQEQLSTIDQMIAHVKQLIK